jgi:hypothetical protein
MIQDLLFNEAARKRVNVRANEGSDGSNYKIAVDSATAGESGDRVTQQDGQSFIEGGVQEGNFDQYTVTGKPRVVSGDVYVKTAEVVETERSVAWGIVGLLFAGLVSVGYVFRR